MELKDKMNTYAPQPDAEVWNRIEATLRRRRVVRRSIAGGAAAAVVTALVVVMAGRNTEVAPLPQTAESFVASTEKIVETAQVVVNEDVATVNVTQSDVAPAVKVQQISAPHGQMAALPASVQPVVRKSAVAQPVAQEQTFSVQETAVAESPKQEAAPIAQTSKAQSPAPTKAPRTNTPREELVVWVPTAFAPDDPNAEVRNFRVFPNDGATITNFKMYIYNRGGRQVLYTTDLNFVWDGRAKGQAQPMGAYTYIMEYTDAQKGVQHYTGSVILVR